MYITLASGNANILWVVTVETVRDMKVFTPNAISEKLPNTNIHMRYRPVNATLNATK